MLWCCNTNICSLVFFSLHYLQYLCMYGLIAIICTTIWLDSTQSVISVHMTITNQTNTKWFKVFKVPLKECSIPTICRPGLRGTFRSFLSGEPQGHLLGAEVQQKWLDDYIVSQHRTAIWPIESILDQRAIPFPSQILPVTHSPYIPINPPQPHQFYHSGQFTGGLIDQQAHLWEMGGN